MHTAEAHGVGVPAGSVHGQFFFRCLGRLFGDRRMDWVPFYARGVDSEQSSLLRLHFLVGV